MQNPINEEQQNDIQHLVDEEQSDQIQSKTNEEPQNDIHNRINEEEQSEIQNEHDIASGTLGSSKWRIDSDGVLYIGGGNFPPSTDFFLWNSYKNVINKIVFEDAVQASGVMNLFFINFSKVKSIENLPLLDTSMVTMVDGMFENMFALTSLDLSNFDTSAVTNMSSMFSGASALTTLDLRHFDTSAVTNMSNMFSGTTELSSLTLGSDFHFLPGAGLPDIEANDTYTGYWQNIGKGTAKNPQGEYVFTSAELMDQYDGTKMADTFVWQPRHPIPAKYVLDGENVVINIKDIDEILDIFSLANVTAVNENDDTEIVTPIILENNIDKDKAGVYEVYFGIKNDNTVQKKIKVFIVDDSTIIDTDYIVYANDFDFNFTERKNLTEKLVKQLGHIQAFEISTGNPLHEYVHIDTNDLSVIHEMDKPQVCLINLQLDTETRKILQGTIHVNLVDDRGNDSINGEENDPTKDDPTKDDMEKDDTEKEDPAKDDVAKDDSTKEDPTEDDITKDNTVSTTIKEKQTEESTIADKETLSSKEKNNEKENPKNNLPKTNEQTIHPFLELPFSFGSLILYFWKKRQKFMDHKRAK